MGIKNHKMALKSKISEHVPSDDAAAKSITPSNIILGSSHRGNNTATRNIITSRTTEGKLYGYIHKTRNWKQGNKPAEPITDFEIDFLTLNIEKWECQEMVNKSGRPHEVPRPKCGSTFKYESWLAHHIERVHGTHVNKKRKNIKAPKTS